MRKIKGFSMIEVLLALAIGGLVLTAATSLLITISRAWAERPATRDAFESEPTLPHCGAPGICVESQSWALELASPICAQGDRK